MIDPAFRNINRLFVLSFMLIYNLLVYRSNFSNTTFSSKNAAIAVPLKYLSNFWKSLEMLLINCKVELMEHCVYVAGTDNTNADDNTTLLSKTQNYMSLSSLYQQKTIKNYLKFTAKDLKDQCIRINIKNVRIKARQINGNISSNQTL